MRATSPFIDASAFVHRVYSLHDAVYRSHREWLWWNTRGLRHELQKSVGHRAYIPIGNKLPFFWMFTASLALVEVFVLSSARRLQGDFAKDRSASPRVRKRHRARRISSLPPIVTRSSRRAHICCPPYSHFAPYSRLASQAASVTS